MGDEFDATVDTAFLDGSGIDAADPGGFSDPVDIGSMMDEIPSEPMDGFAPEPFDSSGFDVDLPAGETDAIGQLMDGAGEEYFEADDLAAGTDDLAAEADILDPADFAPTDIPDGIEGSGLDAAAPDIAAWMDEGALDAMEDTALEPAETEEPAGSEIGELMDEAEPDAFLPPSGDIADGMDGNADIAEIFEEEVQNIPAEIPSSDSDLSDGIDNAEVEANGMPPEVEPETLDEGPADELGQETGDPPPDIPMEVPREYDAFEQSVLEGKPDFYESGSFYEQGINEFGYQGTCGPTSQANALNELFHTNEFTENNVLNVAVDNNLCSINASLENCGGTTTEQFMELYDKMNEQLDGKINTELYEFGNALDVDAVAAKLDEGCVLNVAVDASALWDQPREYVNSMGIPCDDFFSDHWITVTGVRRDELGNVQGFDIIDSGGGVDYVDADKYHEICFGTDEHKVIDPTAIAVSKNELPLEAERPESDTDIAKNSGQDGWFQRIFGGRNP